MEGRTFGVLITQRLFSHISELDRALGARVAEQIARRRMKFGGRDDLGKLFHIDRFDVKDICAGGGRTISELSGIFPKASLITY